MIYTQLGFMLSAAGVQLAPAVTHSLIRGQQISPVLQLFLSLGSHSVPGLVGVRHFLASATYEPLDEWAASKMTVERKQQSLGGHTGAAVGLRVRARRGARRTNLDAKLRQWAACLSCGARVAAATRLGRRCQAVFRLWPRTRNEVWHSSADHRRM
eukprot:SAG31_NODE_196_length_20699_cov_103.813835_9_plen_156_part_00